jgi:hypothetical protein
MQHPGHTYYLTRCGRQWMSPQFTDDDGACHPRLTIMPELYRSDARLRRLCEQCKADWLHDYEVELDAAREGEK